MTSTIATGFLAPMIKNKSIILLIFLLFTASCEEEGDRFLLDTKNGKAGFITSKTTLEEIKKSGVPYKIGEVYVAEGQCEAGVILYPGTNNELRVYWRSYDPGADQFDCEEGYVIDESKLVRPVAVTAVEPGEWHTEEGLKVGTSLDQLARRYGNIEFGGLGWDYGGGCCFDNKKFPLNLSIEVTHDPTDYLNEAENKEYNEKIVGGDGSRVNYGELSPELRRKLNLRIGELSVFLRL